MHINLILVFFIYGLAFYSMGLALMLESRRSPLLADSRVLRPLAIFGFVHGTHEWFELILLKNEWFEIQFPAQVALLRLGVLVASFLSLIVFALRVLRPGRRLMARDIYLGIGFLSLYAILVVWVTRLNQDFLSSGWVDYADAFARYSLAIPGALLAGLALRRQASQAFSDGRKALATNLGWAGFGFILYALSQALVPPLDIFPANYLNTTTFLFVTGLPIQVVRAVLAVAVTISLIRAAQIVEDERHRQLLAAQEARLKALEQVRQELLEREAMRRELLRHTVIAQEEERARIARELHDETAQILTAFSLHLAALQDSLPKTRKANDMLERLQALSRQMSEGIYCLVHDLRPAQLDDLGLVAALKYLADEVRKRMGLRISLEINSPPRQRLDPLVETVFFRVAQEALTNVARHANVKDAQVRLDFSPQQVILQICDKGAGFDVNRSLLPPHGWGLAGMRERAESIGARIQIQSSPGSGTIVEVVVPLAEPATLILEDETYEYHPLDAG